MSETHDYIQNIGNSLRLDIELQGMKLSVHKFVVSATDEIERWLEEEFKKIISPEYIEVILKQKAGSFLHKELDEKIEEYYRSRINKIKISDVISKSLDKQTKEE